MIYDGPRAPSDPRRGSHPTKVGPRVLVKAAKPPLRSARFLATLYTQPQKALRNLVLTTFGPRRGGSSGTCLVVSIPLRDPAHRLVAPN